MQRRRCSRMMRVLAWTATVATAGLEVCQAPCEAMSLARHRPRPYRVSELKPGLTQTPDGVLLKKINARMEARRTARPDARPMTAREMNGLRGRGPYRSKYFAGTLPWHRSFRNVNLCNGNLFLSYTDIQVAPARGAGLALQRTYNSQDDRIGAFGVGWTFSYDIRMSEEGGTSNYTDREDFFGAEHRYHRDADGLYTPPAYLYDQLNSDYNTFLVNGPVGVIDDTDIAMDGTIKHFNSFGSTVERVCDYIQDRYGNRTVLAYTQVTMPDGTQRNLLKSVTDPSGRELDFAWSDLGTGGALWRIVQAEGHPSSGLAYTVTYDYYTDSTEVNAANDLYNLKDVQIDSGAGNLDRTTTFGYTGKTGANGTENGLLNSVTDPLRHVVGYAYEVTFTTPGGVQYPPWTGTAWVSSVTEPAGVDANGIPRTATWTITPNYLQGPPTYPFYATIQCATPFVAPLTVSAFSDNYLRFAYYSYAAGSPMSLWDTAYDTDNNVTVTGEAFGSNNQYLYKTDVYAYGPHGNVLTHVLAGYGTDATVYYDGSQYFQKKSVTDGNGHATTFIVGDDQGNDPLGIVPQSPGNKGSILHVQDAGYNDPSSPSYQKQYTYYYNQYGQKTKELNLNGVETDYYYADTWGNLTMVVQDPGGTGHLNKTTSMAYDINSRVQTSVDANGLTTQFSYNDVGQPIAASFPASGTAPAETITYGYDQDGRTTGVTDNRGTTVIAYEPGCDRVGSVTDPVTGTVGYTYGVTGERLTMSLPGGGVFTYNYGPSYSTFIAMMPKDDPNALSLSPFYILDDQNNRIDLNSYSLSNSKSDPIDASGHLTSIRTNETFAQNGSLATYQEADYAYRVVVDPNYGYSYSGQVASLATTFNNVAVNPPTVTPLLENDYTYDNAQQRLTNTVTVQGVNPRTEKYGYDDLNRLSTVDYGDGQTQSYQFDAMGNRLTKVDSASGTENSTFNAANMLTMRGNNVYTNDADGNTLSGGGRAGVWDSENRLVNCVNGANVCSYKYGADGIRRQTVVNGTTTDFVLDNSMFVRELRPALTGGETNFATYLTGPRGPEYRRDDSNGGIVRWYVYDALGSVIEEVDANGNVTSTRKYDVYGATRGSTGTATSKHRFVGALGHPSEDETGLIYMQARYMDPAAGRFISEDPGKNGENWFTYALDNPVNFMDADGRDPILTFEWALSWEGLWSAFEFIGRGAELLAYAGTAYSAYALIRFFVDVHQAKSSLEVEQAWGEFMERWSTFNDPEEPLGSVLAATTLLAVYTGQSSILETGGIIGANMAMMCIGYDLRIDYYIRQIDDD